MFFIIFEMLVTRKQRRLLETDDLHSQVIIKNTLRAADRHLQDVYA